MPLTIDQITAVAYPAVQQEMRRAASQWAESAFLRQLEAAQEVAPARPRRSAQAFIAGKFNAVMRGRGSARFPRIWASPSLYTAVENEIVPVQRFSSYESNYINPGLAFRGTSMRKSLIWGGENAPWMCKVTFCHRDYSNGHTIPIERRTRRISNGQEG